MKRRHFLEKGALAGAGLLAGPALNSEALAAKKRAGANRGVIFKAVKGGKSVNPDKLAELKELGFDGIEGSSPGMEDPAGVRKMVADAGLRMHGVVDNVHWKQRLSSPDAAVREIGRAALEQSIRDAKAVGGSSVLLVPGRVSGDDETHDDVWNRSIVEIRKVLPVASELGIRVLIETVWNGFCESPEVYRDYLDEIDSPWVGAYFDIGNMQKFAPAHEWIRTLGARTVKLDVKDWGVESKFCPLGQGDVDWAEVRVGLKETGFSGWATREGSDGGVENTARLMDELLDL
jgi:L-ribulose-5-phosphate 3-epimerase